MNNGNPCTEGHSDMTGGHFGTLLCSAVLCLTLISSAADAYAAQAAASSSREASSPASSSIPVIQSNKLQPDASRPGLTATDTHSGSAGQSADGAALELNESVRLALNHYPSIADAISQLSQAGVGIDVARAGYFPKVTTGLGGGSNSPTGGATTTSVEITQMIYDFNKVKSAVGQANATVKRQQAEVLREIQSVERQTAEAYVNVSRYQALVRIAEDQVSAMERVYEMAELRASAGVSTRSDPIQAGARLHGARASLGEMRAQSQRARQHLRTLIGSELSGQVAPLSMEQASGKSLSVDPDTNLMPDVMVAQAEAEISQKQLDAARADRLPTVSLDYSLNKNLTGINPTTFARNGSNHTLMVTLTWNAFQGGALNAQVNAANYALDAARSRIERAQLDGMDAALDSREQALGAKNRASDLVARKASLESARDLYQEQYKLGSRSILDLLSTEEEFFQAASDETQVQHDYWIGVVDYVAATGAGNEFYGIGADAAPGLEGNR
ncbi:hypothetical protein CIC12_13540 [Burkholderia sp. SG-MS1]|uniref:TolC family outer membrane protein n=1 Tax=Paraburkholderia sp. SG-MS1 TaxID=2023741 RepID=UPI001447089E|nr:TolC family outer membrane protein [Paraburkholderia sp. SG-MS1]NKJ47747.1 hypothetical protein [Paraburkholderia sp. SG-MS1]